MVFFLFKILFFFGGGEAARVEDWKMSGIRVHTMNSQGINKNNCVNKNTMTILNPEILFWLMV